MRYTAIYARQSADRPGSESIELQVEECQKKIDKSLPTKIYDRDRGCTGANTNRADYQRLESDIKAGLICAVYVYKLDRISRSVRDFAGIIELFQENNVEFYSATQPQLCLTSNSDSLNTFVLQFTSLFAQFEREMIQTRCIDSYYQRLGKGILNGGMAPFGYIRTRVKNGYGDMYGIDEEKSKIVQYLYDQYGNTDKSLGKLVQWLNDNEIKTNGKAKSCKHFWNSNALSTMLKNPAYVRADAAVYTYLQSRGVRFNNPVQEYTGTNGIYLYGCRTTKKSAENPTAQKRFKYTNMVGDFATLAPHVGLVDSSTWLNVQLKLKSNKAIGNGGKSVKSWLTGIVKCGYCGKAIIFCQTRDTVYLSCLGRKDKHCYERKKSWKVEELESKVEPELLKFLKNLPVRQEKETKRHQPEINILGMKIAELEEEINNCIDTIAKGGKLAQRLEIKAEQLLKQEQEYQAEITRLTIKSTKQIFGGYNIDDVLKEWPEMDVEQRKIVAKVFINKILFKDDSLEIVYNFD